MLSLPDYLCLTSRCDIDPEHTLLWRKPISEESCIHCGQPADVNDRETGNGRVHERCWDAFNEEKPVAKSSVVARIFGFSMVAVGAVVLSVGLAALSMASALDRNSQNILEAMVSLVLWFGAVGVAFLAIPAGAIMLLIAFLTWVLTNNNAFKNYVAGGVAIAALSVFVIGPTVLSWVNSYERSNPTNSHEKPEPIGSNDARKPDGTYIDKQRDRSGLETSGTEEIWVGGVRVGYAEQTYWPSGGLRYDNRTDAGMPRETWFYESGMKKSEHWTDSQNTGWWGSWYENGQQEFDLHLVNGNREGPQIYWHENGQEKSTGNYVGNRMEGPQTWWHENGQMKHTGNYVDGLKEGQHTNRHENGEMKHTGNYVADVPEGPQIYWRENGQKLATVNVVDGKHHGLSTHWHENGQKKAEWNNVNGKREGVVSLWDEDGQIISEDNYVNGVKQ